MSPATSFNLSHKFLSSGNGLMPLKKMVKENFVEKGEIPCDKQFPLFPTKFFYLILLCYLPKL